MIYLSPLHKKLMPEEAGGKASGLSQLIAFGVKVPRGFAVRKTALNQYQADRSLPPGFIQELEDCINTLPGKQLIVRSSGIGEDSKHHSFAGQLDSFVVPHDPEAVRSAILKCWDGLNNERVIAYQAFSGQSLFEMGVVIQEFLEADYAGVTFTRAPNDEFAIYTEYVKGGSEALVSGKVTPLSFSISTGDAPPRDLPFNGHQLIGQSRLLKEQFGSHLDIEWVAIGDEIYFVQARPITVKSTARVYWTNTNLNENYPDPISPLLYSIARDAYYHYFKNLANLLQIDKEAIRSLEYDFSNAVGIWSNRIYYNMTSIHNILSSSPLKDYFKEAFNQFVGYGDRKDAASSGISGKTSLLSIGWRLVWLNISLERHVKIIEKKVSDFSSRVDTLPGGKAQGDLFYEFLDLRFNQWYHASLADFFSMIHYKWLGKLTQKFYGDQSVGVHNTLVQAIPGLISSAPLNDTWKLVEHIDRKEGGRQLFSNHTAEKVYQTIFSSEKWESTQKLIQEYLDKWGFRCSGELMFFKENYIENPVKFIELVQSYMRNTAQNPEIIIAHKDKERRLAMRQFATRIFRKRHILLPLSIFETGQLYLVAKLCKQAISSRERVRYKQAEMYYKFKVVVKSIGREAVQKGLLEKEEDILFLNYKEIGELISSSGMFGSVLKQLVTSRKEIFSQTNESFFPDSFSTEFGERPDHVSAKIALVEGATEFSGLAASGGRVKARVKVLESVLEGHKINKGEILVTKQTDPGWAMIFPIIGGLIVERGGALSHGAIVAREFGIPAVIGIENITGILKDNDEVIVDGDLGKIQIL